MMKIMMMMTMVLIEWYEYSYGDDCCDDEAHDSKINIVLGCRYSDAGVKIDDDNNHYGNTNSQNGNNIKISFHKNRDKML